MNCLLRLSIFSLLIGLLACSSPPENPTDFDAELDFLRDSVDRYDYLKEQLSAWRGVYNKRTKLLRQQSQLEEREYQRLSTQFEQENAQHIARLLAYLDRFGYPNERGNYQLDGLSVVTNVHYLIDSLPDRKRFFDYFYQGWQMGKIEDADFSMYLNRNHQLEFGEYVTLPGVFTERDRLEVLLKRYEGG